MAATLFDYNGVLADDERLHLATFRDVMAPYGIELSEADYWETYLGFDDREAFTTLLERHGHAPKPELVRALTARKKVRYLERAKDELRFFDGALELMTLRAQLGPIVIVSGALRDEIELGLSLLGAQALVAGIVSAEDTARGKPDPEGYERGLELLARADVADPRARAVVFEDSLDGIRAAKAARLACVGIAHSYPERQLGEAGADHTVACIAEVKTKLPALVGSG